MNRLTKLAIAGLMALTFCAAALAVAPDVVADESASYSMDQIDDLGIYPGSLGVSGSVEPVFVVADSDGNVEMVCVDMNSDDGGEIRKGEKPDAGYSRPEVLATALRSTSLNQWRTQHRQSN